MSPSDPLLLYLFECYKYSSVPQKAIKGLIQTFVEYFFMFPPNERMSEKIVFV